MKHVYYYEYPVGTLGIAQDEKGVTNIFFRQRDALSDAVTEETDLIKRAAAQLDEYFAGTRKAFDIPLSFYGTEFQKKVWHALCTIPYGETRSYKQIAEQAGCPGGARAVGMANNQNPIMIVVPCHRVIGANGKLVGYASGVDVKKFLLDLEKKA